MDRTVTEDEFVDALKSEPPLAEQVLILGQYVLQLINNVNALALAVQQLQDESSTDG